MSNILDIIRENTNWGDESDKLNNNFENLNADKLEIQDLEPYAKQSQIFQIVNNEPITSRIQIGTGATVDTGGSPGIAIGEYATSWGGRAIALGDSTSASMNTIAIGYQSKNDIDNTVSFGDSSKNLYRRLTNIADAVGIHDAVTLNQVNGFATLEYLDGNFLEFSEFYNTIFNGNNNQQTIRIGYSSAVSGTTPIAIGYNARANGNRSISLGYQTIISMPYCTAIGCEARVLPSNAADGDSTSTNDRVFSVGYNNGDSSFNYRIVNLKAGIHDNDAVNLGQVTDMFDHILFDDYSNEGKLIKIGNGLTSTGVNTEGVALGYNVSATGNSLVAVGNGASATSGGSIAIGTGASATGTESIAIGYNSVAIRSLEFSVGSSSHTRIISNVKNGTQDNDAVNLSQLNTAITNLNISSYLPLSAGIGKKITGTMYIDTQSSNTPDIYFYDPSSTSRYTTFGYSSPNAFNFNVVGAPLTLSVKSQIGIGGTLNLSSENQMTLTSTYTSDILSQPAIALNGATAGVKITVGTGVNNGLVFQGIPEDSSTVAAGIYLLTTDGINGNQGRIRYITFSRLKTLLGV